MSSEPRKIFGLALHWQILIGLLIGAGIGWGLGVWAVGQLPGDVTPAQRGVAAGKIATGSGLYLVLDLVGDLFINGLQLIVVPLVVSSILLAVAGMSAGGERDFGRLGLRTLVYYTVTSLLAIGLGLLLFNIFTPGVDEAGRGILVGQDLGTFSGEQNAVASKTAGKGGADFLNVFREMVPANVFAAAAEGKLLGLITVAIVVGVLLGRYEGKGKGVLMAGVEGVYDLTLAVTALVLMFAPIGVIGLLGATVGEQYAKLRPDGRFAVFGLQIVKFAAVALAALVIHFGVTLPVIMALFARVNPLRHFAAMGPALATAFSTASSSATLPVTIDCVERRAGVSNRVASFTLPLGATVNMDGTALYECVAAMFICRAFGVELGFAQQVFVVLTALLTSVGVAGVPAASLVAIVVILNGVEAGLPPGALPEGVSLVAGMGLLFVFDRPLDMCRTAVNIFSDSVGAVIIARMEGETGVLAK